MFIMRFTERAYVAYTEADVRESFRNSVRLTFPNRHFNPALGADLYNEYLDEYEFSEGAGFDGLMLNEHHNTPTCLGAAMNLEAAILARITKKPKIVLLGNPLPIFDNPIRLAEELAEIDMISRGRLVSGFVRGTGIESWATNTNPVHNRERFEEAHDLVIKTWTTPGPFRWEGTHYQHRVVNPWAVPLQKPHPRIWIPGVLSRETIVWSAKQRYPYIALNTSIEATKRIWATYDAAAAEVGYTPGPENRGYLQRVHVAETEEKAIENARQFMWMQGEFTGLAHPVWSSPSGYFSPEQRRGFVEFAVGRATSPRGRPTFEQQLADMQIIAGTPKTVIAKLRRILEETRPGIMAIWGNDGAVAAEDARTCIRLLGQEVMPALRELGKELDLKSPFEANAPVSLADAAKRRKPLAAD